MTETIQPGSPSESLPMTRLEALVHLSIVHYGLRMEHQAGLQAAREWYTADRENRETKQYLHDRREEILLEYSDNPSLLGKNETVRAARIAEMLAVEHAEVEASTKKLLEAQQILTLAQNKMRLLQDQIACLTAITQLLVVGAGQEAPE